MPRCAFDVGKSDALVRVTLRAAADVSAARELYAQVVHALSPEHDLVIDLESLEKLDAAGLAARRFARAHGPAFHVVAAHGPALRALEIVEATGLLADGVGAAAGQPPPKPSKEQP